MYTELKGVSLIEAALSGRFDVIGHGCNCFCKMKSGIAPLMAENFGCDMYPFEAEELIGNPQKLGNYQGRNFSIGNTTKTERRIVKVLNIYSQYYYASHPLYKPSPYGIPLDYDALRIALRKMNIEFKGMDIGLPMIGCGKAKGDWNIVSEMIQKELSNANAYICIIE